MSDLLDIARGTRNTRGLTYWHVEGRNTDIDTGSDPESVWAAVTALWVPPTVARVHNIASSSVNDDGDAYGSGSGAHYVRVYGINEPGRFVSEEVTLNGTANVATKFSYTCIFLMTAHRHQAASLAQNAGDISATAVTDATVTCRITADYGRSKDAVFQVPRGHTAYIAHVSASMGSAAITGGCDLTVKMRPHRSYLWQDLWERSVVGTGSSYLSENIAIPVTELSFLRIDGMVSVDNTDIMAGMDIILKNDNKPTANFVQDIGNTNHRFMGEIG